MSGIFNPFKKENNNEIQNQNQIQSQNQQNVGNFALQQTPQNILPRQNTGYQNETEMYQKGLIESKNEGYDYIKPRQKVFGPNPDYNNTLKNNQYVINQSNTDLMRNRFAPNISYGNSNFNNQEQQYGQQNNYQNQYQNNDYINQNQYQQNFSNYPNQSQMRVVQNYNNYQNQYNQNLRQEYLDFDNNINMDYGNYRDENQYNRMVYPPVNNFNSYNATQENYNNRPLYENYQVPNNNRLYGYNDFSNNNQFYNQNNQNNQYGYNPEINYAPSSSNNYNPYDNRSYKERFKNASVMPKEIGKEVISEKLRLLVIFLLGVVGIITTSLMLAIYYKAGPEGTYINLKREQVIYPFFSILLLIVSVGFFGTSVTDFGLLFSNVKKYERDLYFGKESVPYFITRNYRNLISRAVYLNWVAFCIYIFGAMILGIMYALQSQYLTGNNGIYVFFWKIGELKSLESEIKINIIILFTTLIIHVSNIITSRTRKNNIISYYGYEIIPQQEIREIKKRANKISMIIFFTTLAIILFLIVVPWLILRKKRGLPLKPWGKVV